MMPVTHLLITATVTLTTNQLPPARSAKNRAAQRLLCARGRSASQGLQMTLLMIRLFRNDRNPAAAVLEQVLERTLRPLNLLPEHLAILCII